MDCHRCNSHCGSGKGTPKSGLFKNWSLGLRNQQQPQIPDELTVADAQIALVGMPNVGKSVLFHALTGIYATVSNYPGTTVEVSRGVMRLGEQTVTVIDTPGMYSLLPISEEEAVSKTLLLTHDFASIIHVVDGKNLGRMLPLTLQLLELDLPLILAINMMDEARRLGLALHPEILSQQLQIPVILMAAGLNQGIQELKQTLQQQIPAPPLPLLV
ncbi:50S ribosome-binding GTPase [Spirulina subsalsa FACHB-351]|uniref:50S ribosome-binding GTPase n=1 Tax=Spirulina subsalsa FACHB-351 TaxID=234711 RepID=A0ABT3L1J1_9CYAN|nr:FeoB small GTPase domain-containing protein [Spirulina subsalsa]MCW6035368.1 50S ribosome-binding GTPase [Spirulina subsalsa FACHB-351]